MNPKFGVWLHLGMAECCVPFLGHLTSDLFSGIIVLRATVKFLIKRDFCICCETLHTCTVILFDHFYALYESNSQSKNGSDFKLYDGSDLKTYLLMRW